MWCWSMWRLNKKREETLSTITGERSIFETMMQRARIGGMATPGFAVDVLARFGRYESRAMEVSTNTELDDLADDAQRQGQLRAYLCPDSEVAAEGLLGIDLMEEWGVPREQVSRLRSRVEEQLNGGDAAIARGALRAVFEESDSWSDYVEDYGRKMFRWTMTLLAAIALSSLLAIWLFHKPGWILPGILLAGLAGGCASVIVWAPRLSIAPSGEFEDYQRRIFGRLGIAIATSLIGGALLAWGLVPVSIRGESFSDLLTACTTVPISSCSDMTILVLLGVSMLLGFSERALSRLEERLI